MIRKIKLKKNNDENKNNNLNLLLKEQSLMQKNQFLKSKIQCDL